MPIISNPMNLHVGNTIITLRALYYLPAVCFGAALAGVLVAGSLPAPAPPLPLPRGTPPLSAEAEYSCP